MKQQLKIGIDVGGTNTDLALLTKDNDVLFTTKINAKQGVIESIRIALQQAHTVLRKIEHELIGIFIGSTYATNALLEPTLLEPVGIIRIGSTMKNAVPPRYTLPTELQHIIVATQTIEGGHKIDGTLLAPLDIKEIKKALSNLISAGMQSCAIVGTFSPLFPEHEKEVSQIINKQAPHIPITCSHQLGGLNFIEREHNTICNAALIKTLQREFAYITNIMDELQIECPLFMIQNNGTTITMKDACAFPIKTIAAGPANSLMGAMLLTKQKDAIIIDIGGTSSDIGIIRNNYPQQSFGGSTIAGVSFNIPIADIQSIALGGGSIITFNEKQEPHIGPKSIAKKLLTEAQSYGGPTLTLFDCAVAAGLIKEMQHISPPIEKETADAILTKAGTRIAQQLEIPLLRTPNTPIILVGGSSFLEPFIQKALPNQTIIVPLYAAIANAFGAACARISGTIDTNISLLNRTEALNKLRQEAYAKATLAGARPETITIIDQQIIPHGYSTDATARVIITAAGYL